MKKEMKTRWVFGALIFGACMSLLLVSNKLTYEASRAWKFGSLAAVLIVYLALMWARDRFIPPERREQLVSQSSVDKDSGSSIKKANTRYWNPWVLLVASFALIGAALMFVMRADINMTAVDATRTAFRVSAWGLLVISAAMSVASYPRSRREQLAYWWLPGGGFLILALLAVSLVSELVLLVVGRPDADQPNIAILLIAPIAVFVWRSIKLVKSWPHTS